MEWDIFCNNIKEILNIKRYERSSLIECKITDERIKINCYSDDEKSKCVRYVYTRSEFIEDCKMLDNNSELNVINEKCYEIPISAKNRRLHMIFRNDEITEKEFKDYENDLQYIIAKPSNQFLLKLVSLKIKTTFFSIWILIKREYKFEEKNEEKPIFDLLKIIYQDYITLRIVSAVKYKKAFFEKLADAFIFNINYNMDIGIRQIYDIENSYEIRKSTRFRNGDMGKIAPPRLIYKRELVEQYNVANTSEDPFIKYLCYYHVLEHFYGSVYEEQLVNVVKQELTSPSFSIKDDRKIMKLIKRIEKKIKFNKTSFVGDELEALELVLKKYVDIEKLKNEIDEIDSELVDYYDKTKVDFSEGVAVNFNDKISLCKNVAKRIYYTRNALVHYKSNDLNIKNKGLYSPIKDRKTLLKELPLIRILAEEVIINTSDIW